MTGSERPGPRVDARRVRFEEGVVAVVLLAGFVFHLWWVMPLLAAVLGATAAIGARANVLALAFDAAIAPRLRPPVRFTDPDSARLGRLLSVAALCLATLLTLIGLGGLAWLVTFVVAVSAALAATTGISVADSLRNRYFGRR